MISKKLEGGSPTLIVDTGNFARGTDSANELKRTYMAKAMHLMGYDAVNLAREEVVLGSGRILDLRDRERVPLVSINLLRGEGARSFVSPYLIKRLGTSRFLGFEYGGVKVAIVGLTDQGSQDHKVSENSGELIVAEPEKMLQPTLAKLRKHCDVVIVLSDLALQEAVQLTEEVGGVDLFFIQRGIRAKYVEQKEGTIFVTPASRGKELGDIELILDDHNQVTSHQVQWTLLNRDVAGDEEVGQLVSDYKVALKALQVPQQGCGK